MGALACHSARQVKDTVLTDTSDCDGLQTVWKVKRGDFLSKGLVYASPTEQTIEQ